MKKPGFIFLLFILAFIFLFTTSALSNQCKSEVIEGGEIIIEEETAEEEATIEAAEFDISNLTIRPSEVNPGDVVTISVNVSNMDNKEGTYILKLIINGFIEDTISVTLGGRETVTISFMVKKEIVESYLVEVEDLKQSFEVIAPPEFIAGDSTFYFIGACVPSWRWYFWSEESDEELVKSSRNNGITVLHMMYGEQFETQLGVYQEDMLVKLDHLLDCASRYGVYITFSFIHTLQIAQSQDDPYYYPSGIEGLIENETLSRAFKKRIEMFITRKNTVNGREYREDPTILAWVICDEPVSGSQNYPEAPDVTVLELQAWLEETASYIEYLDSNHLITVFNTGGTPRDDDFGECEWKAWDVPSLDFIMTEDGEMTILDNLSDPSYYNYPLGLFSLDKPVVIGVAFPDPGDAPPTEATEEWHQKWDDICEDYPRQAWILKEVILDYNKRGVTGVVIPQWMSDLVMDASGGEEECFNYTSSNESVTEALQDAASQIGPAVYPSLPLQFVKISN